MTKRMNRKTRGMTTNPPFPYDRDDTTRYSLEEIAIEFILLDAMGWSDKDRCNWIMLAIAYNFEEPEWESQFQAFPDAYIQALKKEPSDLAASVDNVRQLIERRPLKDWPRKEELEEWDTPSG